MKLAYSFLFISKVNTICISQVELNNREIHPLYSADGRTVSYPLICIYCKIIIVISSRGHMKLDLF